MTEEEFEDEVYYLRIMWHTLIRLDGNKHKPEWQYIGRFWDDIVDVCMIDQHYGEELSKGLREYARRLGSFGLARGLGEALREIADYVDRLDSGDPELHGQF